MSELINMTDEYKTRDGRDVEVLRIDVTHKYYPVIALITEKSGQQFVCSYTASGYLLHDEDEHSADLIKYDPLKEFRDLPIDTPIWVWQQPKINKMLRHFAGVYDDEIYVWADGKTSYTAPCKIVFDCSEIATPEELNKERIKYKKVEK